MKKVKDYIVHDKHYLRVKDSDKIDGDPQLLGSRWNNKTYYIRINESMVEMNRYYGVNDPKTAIINMYNVASKPVKGLTTIILDYLFDELGLDQRYVESNLTKLSNQFLNSLNNVSYEPAVFKENLSLFDNFKELKDWLTSDKIDELMGIDKSRKLYLKALSNKVDCF